MQQKGPPNKPKIQTSGEKVRDFGPYAPALIIGGVILLILSPVIFIAAVFVIALGALARGIRNIYRNRANRISETLEQELFETPGQGAEVSTKPSPLAQNDQLIPDVKPEAGPIKAKWPEPSMEDLQKIGPEKFGKSEDSLEEKLALFKAACIDIKNNYPPEMIEAFGLYDLAALPVLDIQAFQDTLQADEREDPVYHLASDSLEGNKVMRGIIPDTNPKQPVIFCQTDEQTNKGKAVLAVFQSMDTPRGCTAIGTQGIELMSGQAVAMTSPRAQGLFSAVKEVMDGKKEVLARRKLNDTLNDLSYKAPEDKMPKMR